MNSDPAGFSFGAFDSLPILDGHVHVWRDLDPSLLWTTIARTGATRCNVLSLSLLPPPSTGQGTYNALALRFKQSNPERIFAFASLDYASLLHAPQPDPNELMRQAQRVWDSGFDGIKMWEGKPSVYAQLPDHLEGPLYAAYWAFVEQAGVPITIHLADPLRFWDPARIGLDPWSYADARFPSREGLYAESERILDRHPSLRLIFAHFLFFWDDLPRAGGFLDRHPSVAFDLTPGVAGYLQLSQDIDAARDFFIRYQDRLIYGTDLAAGPVVNPDMPFDPVREMGQAWLVRTCLETDVDTPIPAGVGAVTNQFAGQRLHGMKLPRSMLEKIYWRNFERMVGREPRR